ncbi:MAG: hypothetical protein ACFFCE_18465 [Promethearchaeota archaeon]
MQVQYKLVKVVCPRCGVEKEISVPQSIFEEKKIGHIKIRVPKGAACKDHIFIVYLNNQGTILGYESIDLTISSLTKLELREENYVDNGKAVSLRDFIEMIGFQCLAGLIHAKLFNYPSLIIQEKESEVNLELINHFLDDIMPEKYKDTEFLKTIDYSKDKDYSTEYFYVLVNNQRKPAFLINLRKHIVQKPWKTSLELEYSFINSVLYKNDKQDNLYTLEFCISKFLKDVDDIILFLKSIKRISKRNLNKKLQEIKDDSLIVKNYINFIIEFIQQRITPEIAKKIQG